MKKIVLFIIMFFLAMTSAPGWASRIMVVRGSGIKIYEQALQGFKSVVDNKILHGGFKSIYPEDIEEFVLSHPYDKVELERKIRLLAPDLILAIGRKAICRVKKIQNIPIVYVMDPFPDNDIIKQTNFTGVYMRVAAATQLTALTKAFPDIKRLGLIYDPARSSTLVKEVKLAVAGSGVILVTKQVRTSVEVRDAILGMAEEVDALWMLPDLTVITPQTLSVLRFFSVQQDIPVLAFADKYLNNGATIAVFFDVYAMGVQAGEMARKILNGAEVSSIVPVMASKSTVKFSD